MFAPKLYIIKSFPIHEVVEQNYAIGYGTYSDQRYNIKQQDSQLLRQLRLISGCTARFNPFIFFVDGGGYSGVKEAIPHLLRDGIRAMGHTFLFGPRSASMVRNQIYSFIRDDVYEETMRRVRMDIKTDKVVLSKLAAYEGLVLSSGHCLENFFPKVIVVADCKINLPNQHIKYLYEKEVELTNKDGQPFIWRQPDITSGVRDMTIDAFDGFGIMHSHIAEQIQQIIGSKTPVTSAIVRAPYIKGLLVAVDYTRYCHEHGVEFIQDIWGKWHSVDDEMIILTKSQYKGFGYMKHDGTYADWDRYWETFHKYQHVLSIAKWGFSFDEEPVMSRMSYQPLQDLRLDFDQFKHLADPSIRWAESIIDGDQVATYAFLGLFADKANPVSPYAKAILKNPEMLNEPIVRKYLRDTMARYIDDMKVGKLYAKACYKFLVPDVILFLEWICGLPLVGSLKSDEFYTRNADGPLLGEMLVERSPHIASSEHTILNAVAPESLVDYVGDLANICVVNCFSLTAQRLNGADSQIA